MIATRIESSQHIYNCQLVMHCYLRMTRNQLMTHTQCKDLSVITQTELLLKYGNKLKVTPYFKHCLLFGAF